MNTYEENVKTSIKAYAKALNDCRKLDVWPRSEGIQPQYFHTPLQQLAISKLKNCQENHRFVIEEYAKHVGPVPEHFFPDIGPTGYLMAPGVKRITPLQLILAMFLMIGITVGSLCLFTHLKNHKADQYEVLKQEYQSF
ncbi:hypothetical protein [Pseudomonas amygdali]|uniref:Uncharacterized protein n=2 Tax=Pseudomonas amygdali pv. lachrymans TaxID=53707 RepID=A0ABR5KUB5_PSEAV|nr:hypothetical protein [Pseudomonas amygdali]AXH59768.1 hypothetical protein PLA107_031590 [Pseudomonas amygdali pv. lachrymans str. M301315]KPC17188.1 Uncharacterized protein AC499_0390 [Pseudomonas amygdali pv. lachrymans]KPC18147.1 Uncharacterized protein AC499_1349 [Pseudomonas amygdali pv. lachrymans]RMT05777.1 hypothetical protein ALP54_03666 [Pseudomonas amygdali pv. lachrymans]